MWQIILCVSGCDWFHAKSIVCLQKYDPDPWLWRDTVSWRTCTLDSQGGYLTKFNTGRLRPEVQLLTLLYTILAEKVPLPHTYLKALDPLSKPLQSSWWTVLRKNIKHYQKKSLPHSPSPFLHSLQNFRSNMICRSRSQKIRVLCSLEEMLRKRQVLFIQFMALLNA